MLFLKGLAVQLNISIVQIQAAVEKAAWLAQWNLR
jgi:hypothetical protein